MKELIDYAKKNPGKLSNASSSNGSPGHVSGELFKYMTGTDIVHVPYKGGAPAIADLIAGNVELMFESTNSIAPHVRAGRVRALAVTGEKRSRSLPEVPTMIEAGVPGYEAYTFSLILGPAGMQQEVIDTLDKASRQVMADPSTAKFLEGNSMARAGNTAGAEKVFNEVSVMIGYALKPGSESTLQVGGASPAAARYAGFSARAYRPSPS